MNNNYPTSNLIAGRLVTNSCPPPASLEDVFANAIAERLKVHSTDGMSLFVFGTRSRSGPKLHLYPISAVNVEIAFCIAQRLHTSRGLPPSIEWTLYFQYEVCHRPDNLN